MRGRAYSTGPPRVATNNQTGAARNVASVVRSVSAGIRRSQPQMNASQTNGTITLVTTVAVVAMKNSVVFALAWRVTNAVKI